MSMPYNLGHTFINIFRVFMDVSSRQQRGIIMSKKINDKQAELFKACIGGTTVSTIVCVGGYKRVKREAIK